MPARDDEATGFPGEPSLLAPRGRVRQHTEFMINDLDGTSIEALKSAEHSGAALMVFLKVDASPWWHRFFTDAGLVVWEEWDHDDSFRDFDDQPIVDLGARFGLVGEQITSIRCIPSLLSVHIDIGRAILRFEQVTDADGLALLEGSLVPAERSDGGN